MLSAAVALYFAPTIVASMRHHHNYWPIFVVNLLFGWTFIGWGVAMVMASTRVQHAPA